MIGDRTIRSTEWNADAVHLEYCDNIYAVCSSDKVPITATGVGYYYGVSAYNTRGVFDNAANKMGFSIPWEKRKVTRAHLSA